MSDHDRPLAAHAVRPTDLVALVTFDGEVFANQAVTRERLARPSESPRPLGAAIEQWLGLGRHTWVDVRGRQIEGIATARELGHEVWQIDTLIDASSPEVSSGEAVLETLLRKAVDAARERRVTHVLLRTPFDAPAHAAAVHSGFRRATVEQVYRGRLEAAASQPEEPIEVRAATEADRFAQFQLFNRTLPLEGREAMAATLDEWEHTRERRWMGRGSSEWVCGAPGRVDGTLSVSPTSPTTQVDLLVDPALRDGATADALLDVATQVMSEHGLAGADLLASVLDAPAAGAPLEARGLVRDAEYALLCHRTTRAVKEPRRMPAGAAVPTSG